MTPKLIPYVVHKGGTRSEVSHNSKHSSHCGHLISLNNQDNNLGDYENSLLLLLITKNPA